MKMYLLGGAGLVAAYLFWKHYQNTQVQSPLTNNPNNKAANLQGQPAQNFPYAPNASPRVDNSNQPWYGGNRNMIQAASAATGTNPSDVTKAAQSLSSVADISGSVSDLWSNLTSSNSSPASPDTSTDNTQSSGFDWSSLNPFN